jgi:hypothetical protein
VRFFFDRSCPKRLAKAVRALEPNHGGDEIVFKDERFPIDTPDTEWIGKLATKKGWVVLSYDYEILRKPIERAAWDEAGLTGFFFDGGWGNLKIEEVTWRSSDDGCRSRRRLLS